MSSDNPLKLDLALDEDELHLDKGLNSVDQAQVDYAEVNPDQAAAALRLGQKWGVPMEQVLADPKYKAMSQAQLPAEVDPVLARYYEGSPARVAISKDDYDHLNWFTRTVFGIHERVVRNQANIYLGDIRYRQMMGTATKQDAIDARNYEETLRRGLRFKAQGTVDDLLYSRR